MDNTLTLDDNLQMIEMFNQAIARQEEIIEAAAYSISGYDDAKRAIQKQIRLQQKGNSGKLKLVNVSEVKKPGIFKRCWNYLINGKSS